MSSGGGCAENTGPPARQAPRVLTLPAGTPSRFLCKQEASAFSRCPGPCGQAAGPPASHFLQVAVVVCPLRRGLGARACPARAALCSVAAHAALRGRLCRPPASPVCTPLSPQGVDQNAKPLIIGPEEDYDPGCLNSEVAVPALLFLALRWHQLLAARSSLAASGWGGVGRKPWPGRPGADSLRAAASVSLPERRRLPGPREAEVAAGPPGGVPALPLLAGGPRAPGASAASACPERPLVLGPPLPRAHGPRWAPRDTG